MLPYWIRGRMKARILFGCGCVITELWNNICADANCIDEGEWFVGAGSQTFAREGFPKGSQEETPWLFQDRMFARSSLDFDLWKLREHLMGLLRSFRCRSPVSPYYRLSYAPSADFLGDPSYNLHARPPTDLRFAWRE